MGEPPPHLCLRKDAVGKPSQKGHYKMMLSLFPPYATPFPAPTNTLASAALTVLPTHPSTWSELPHVQKSAQCLIFRFLIPGLST